MKLPLHNEVSAPSLERIAGRGLYFNRFFAEWSKDFSQIETSDKKLSPKQVFIDNVLKLGKPTEKHLGQYARQQVELVESLGGIWFVAQLLENSVFVTGTGNPHPLENGFLWHPTLDSPYIPGSVFKGVFRSWLETELGYGSELSTTLEEDLEDLKRYFGSASKSDSVTEELQAGDLIFFDALPVASLELKTEVLTPHMGKYYAQGTDSENVGTPESLPADWHNPIPIPFLVMSKGSFLFSVAPRAGLTDFAKNTLNEEWPRLKAALQNCLQYGGAGAKTATGFGRFAVDKKMQKKMEDREKTEEQIKLDTIAELIDMWRADKKAVNDKLNKELREAHKIFVDAGIPYQSALYKLVKSIFIPGDKGKTNKAIKNIMNDFAPGE